MININLVCIPCICLSTEAVGLALCGLGDDVVTLDTPGHCGGHPHLHRPGCAVRAEAGAGAGIFATLRILRRPDTAARTARPGPARAARRAAAQIQTADFSADAFARCCSEHRGLQQRQPQPAARSVTWAHGRTTHQLLQGTVRADIHDPLYF